MGSTYKNACDGFKRLRKETKNREISHSLVKVFYVNEQIRSKWWSIELTTLTSDFKALLIYSAAEKVYEDSFKLSFYWSSDFHDVASKWFVFLAGEPQWEACLKSNASLIYARLLINETAINIFWYFNEHFSPWNSDTLKFIKSLNLDYFF